MYDRETVELALLGLSEGMSAAAVARDLGLGDTTVRGWVWRPDPSKKTSEPPRRWESNLRRV